MNSVVPVSRAISSSREWTCREQLTVCATPWYEAVRGRGRSGRISASSGRPASASRQWASCSAASLAGSEGVPRKSRCHAA